MKNFLKVAAFSLLVIFSFAGFANLGIPKIEPAPPPTEEKIDLVFEDLKSFVVLESIRTGKIGMRTGR